MIELKNQDSSNDNRVKKHHRIKSDLPINFNHSKNKKTIETELSSLIEENSSNSLISDPDQLDHINSENEKNVLLNNELKSLNSFKAIKKTPSVKKKNKSKEKSILIKLTNNNDSYTIDKLKSLKKIIDLENESIHKYQKQDLSKNQNILSQNQISSIDDFKSSFKSIKNRSKSNQSLPKPTKIHSKTNIINNQSRNEPREQKIAIESSDEQLNVYHKKKKNINLKEFPSVNLNISYSDKNIFDLSSTVNLKIIHSKPIHLDSVNTLDFHNESLISSSDDHLVKVWNIGSDASHKSGQGSSLANPEEKDSNNNKIKIKNRQTIRMSIFPLLSSYLSENEYYSGNSAGEINIFSVTSGKLKHKKTIKGHFEPAWSISELTSNNIIVSTPNKIRLINSKTENEEFIVNNKVYFGLLRSLSQHSYIVNTHNNGLYLSEFLLYDLEKNSIASNFKSSNHYISHFDVSTPNILYSCGNNKEIEKFDLRTKKVISSFVAHSEGISCFDLSLDSNLIATAGLNSSVRLFDNRNNKCFNEKSLLCRKYSETIKVIKFHNKHFLYCGTADSYLSIFKI